MGIAECDEQLARANTTLSQLAEELAHKKVQLVQAENVVSDLSWEAAEANANMLLWRAHVNELEDEQSHYQSKHDRQTDSLRMKGGRSWKKLTSLTAPLSSTLHQ